MCLAIAALHLQEPTASELQDSQFDILLQRVRERTTWYYQAEKVNPKSLQFTGFARGQDAMMWVEEVTAYAERARSVTGSGIWHSAAWGDYVFLRAIVLLVMEESFELDVNDDTTEIAIYLGPGDSD